MKTFSLCVVLVISVNLSAHSEEISLPYRTKLHDEIKNKLCVQLKKYFENKPASLKIGVGQFASTPDLDANYSNGIKNTITVELKNIGFIVDSKAPYYLEGKYSKIPSGDKGSYSVKFSLSLIDSSSQESLTQFPIRIDDYVDVAQALGVTAGLGKEDSIPLPPSGEVKSEKYIESREKYVEASLPNLEERNKKVAEYSVTPKFYLNKDLDLIRANESSSYGIKILVKYGQQYKAIPIRKNDEGRPFVDLKKGDIYKIELVNDSKYEAAAKVLIDGLNTFSFSDEKDPDTNYPLHNYHIIDKHEKSVVDGWEKNSERVYEFLTDTYGKDNQQYNLKPVHETGIITVSFSVSYEKNNRPSFIPGTLNSSKFETVRGNEVNSKTASVKREIGPVIDIISIRYSH